MAVKVVDASALASVLFGESAGGSIASRLEASLVMAPTLLRYEIASVCRKKIGRHPERRGALLEALSLFLDLEIGEVEIPPLEVTSLAEESGLTVYDASYLWLSRQLDANLITLDARLEAAASGR
ncbi:MAG: type II toxin-antitoxin system VapC family toxin [Gemmatimonadota bacterium]